MQLYYGIHISIAAEFQYNLQYLLYIQYRFRASYRREKVNPFSPRPSQTTPLCYFTQSTSHWLCQTILLIKKESLDGKGLNGFLVKTMISNWTIPRKTRRSLWLNEEPRWSWVLSGERNDLWVRALINNSWLERDQFIFSAKLFKASLETGKKKSKEIILKLTKSSKYCQDMRLYINW